MAAPRTCSWLAWCSSTIIGIFILYGLSTAGALGGSNLHVEKADYSMKSSLSSDDSVALRDNLGSPSEAEEDYLVSMYQPAENVPHLHRKLGSFTTPPISKMLPQSTNTPPPPPKTPSRTEKQAHPREIPSDSWIAKAQIMKEAVMKDGESDLHHGSPIPSEVIFQEVNAEIEDSLRDQSNYPSEISGIQLQKEMKMLQESKIPRMSNERKLFRSIYGFQKLPQETTPPPQGPSPIQNRVHLLEISPSLAALSKASSVPSSVSISSSAPLQEEQKAETDSNLVFQMLPMDTAVPPQGPSPIHN